MNLSLRVAPEMAGYRRYRGGSGHGGTWPSVFLFLFLLLPVIFVVALETILFVYVLFFAFVYWVFSRRAFPTGLSHILGPLLLILAVGLIGSIGHAPYDVAKDVWYVVNAALALAVGYVLMLNMRDLGRLFRVFVIASTLIAIFHLLRFGLHPELLEMDATDLRRFAGTGYFAPCLAIILLLSARRMRLRIFRTHTWFAYLAFVLCAASVAVSFSRIILLSLVLVSLTIFGWVHFNSRKKVITVVAFAALLVGAGMVLPEPQAIGAHSSLIDKILYSFQELKIKDYYSVAQINENWRGYESARGLRTYLLGRPWEYAVGRGFGSLVDLGLYMPLGGELIRFAPILHNGYIYLLVKTGILGILAYGVLLFRMLRAGTLLSRAERVDVMHAGRLIVGLGLVFVVSSFVISGMFNKEALLPVSLLMGALLAYGHISSAEPQREMPA